MIETITPAVCGSRKRQRLALALFGAGATAAAAALGAALALVGAAAGGRGALLAVAALAALAALRELALLRVPLPQARFQVPERWRSELPLPLWATGYGAGLGVGVATYQPVATFWVACAAAIALARPAPAAACFALYGLGRAGMVAVPALRRGDPADRIERLVGRRAAVGRVNGLALAAVALVLVLAPAAGGQPAPIPVDGGNQLDPSVSEGVVAFSRRFGEDTVVVGASHGVSFRGRAPALDGPLLAYEDGGGVRLVRWRDESEVARVPSASKPALDWPWLAYRTDGYDGGRELWLTNLTTGRLELLASARPGIDLGRPSLAGGRVAWHVAGPGTSRIDLYTLATRKRSVFARSRIALLSHPALGSGRVLWVDSRQGVSRLRVRRLDVARPRTVTLARTWTRNERFWTTALAGRSAYVTRWDAATGVSQIEHVRF
jgi:hypothetical protein